MNLSATFFLALFLMLISAHGQANPDTDVSRKRAIDVRHLALDVRFDWSHQAAYGTSAITFALLQPSRSLTLDAGMLQIERVVDARGRTLSFTYDASCSDGGLVIDLGETRNSGTEITVIVHYRTRWMNESDPNFLGGSFGKGLRFIQPTRALPTLRRQIWSQGEPAGNRYWFPSYDGPDDIRTTELKATVDTALMVVSNGELKSLKQNGDGTHTYYYQASTPYPNYLTSIVVGTYADVRQEVNGIPFHTLCYPDEYAAAFSTTVSLPAMVRYFTERTGIPYPFRSYTQVMVQDYPFPGLTAPYMTSLVSDNMIDDYATHADYLYLWDGVEASSLASQWFGNLIAPQDWSHSWLLKSLVRYMETSYMDHAHGHDEYLLWYLPFDMGAVLADWQSGYRHPQVTSDFPDLEAFANDNYSRSRGALVLRMLHAQLGDARWWTALRTFVKEYRGRLVTTEDFVKSVTASTGVPLDKFFDQWVYRCGMPDFFVEHSFDQAISRLTLTLRQEQKPDSASRYPQVLYYQGPMQVEVDDRIETIWIKPQRETVIDVAVRQKPKLINVDYENLWIRELHLTRTLDQWLYALANSRDTYLRSSAIRELASVARNDETTKQDKLRIADALREVIRGSSYWRLRSTAVSQLSTLFPQSLDEPTTKLFLEVIEKESSWLRATAITALGATKDVRFADTYIKHLSDSSERVVAAAAIAVGKSRSEKAFDALFALKDKPSWKQQRLMSALNGFAQLGDPRAVSIALDALRDNHSPRWFLGNFWDYPYIAAQTLVSLGQGAAGYPIVYERLQQALADGNTSDIFHHALLLTALGDPRGLSCFEVLKTKFKDDALATQALETLASQLNTAITENK